MASTRSRDKPWNCRQKRPLVRKRRQCFIQEHTVALFPRHLLQRQRDQIAEAALGQGVLVGKKPVVGGEADFRPALHRLRQDERAELPRQRGRHRLGKKQPHMPAIAGTRALQRRRNLQPPAGFHDRQHVIPPGIPCRNRWPGKNRSRPPTSDRPRPRNPCPNRSFPDKCQRMTSSVTARKARHAQSAHLIRGFSQIPRTHSLPQAGA